MRLLKRGKFLKLLLVLSVCLAVFLSGCGGENQQRTNKVLYSFKDDKGFVTNFSEKPQRILTLSMGLDGIVLGLVPPERLIAINHLADDPISSNIVKFGKQIKDKINVPTAEYILALSPDVVFVNVWTGAELVRTLRDLGIKVIVLDNPKDIEGVRKNIVSVSKVLGEEQLGKKLLAKMDAKLDEIQIKVEKLTQGRKKKVLLLSLMTTYGGKGCIYDDMCNRAGVVNGITAVGLSVGQALTKELLVKADPDVIIMPVYNNHGNYDTDGFIKQYTGDPALQTLSAVKNKKFFFPREGYTYNCSQDVVFGVQEIALAAYGEAFAQDDQLHLQVWEK